MIPDLPLLNKFQQFSDWCQKWFGIDNFTLAKISAIVMLFLGLTTELVFAMTEFNFWTVANVFVSLITFMIFMFVIKLYSGLCRSNFEFVNPLSHAFTLRLIVWVFAIMIWVTIPALIGMISRLDPGVPEYMHAVSRLVFAVRELFFLLFAYFVSCTPKPKKPKKIKELIKKRVDYIMSVLNPSPNPVLNT